VSGRAPARREDARVLRGQTRYLDDIEPAGVGHVAFVRSEHPHARIVSIRMPEGAPVVTADHLAGSVRPFPVAAYEGAEIADEPHPVLARDEVGYVGQPVALVVADSRAEAEDVAEMVEVNYEPLEAAVDVRDCPDPLLRWHGAGGDVAAAFSSAAHVVTGRYGLPRVAAVPIEPRGCVAEYDARADRLTVWCSAQDPHRPLEQLAHILGRPDASIRVIVPDVGGAFGSKGVIAPEVAAAAAAAIAAGRPLKWTEDRHENFLAAYQGRGMVGELELALDAEGRMLGLRARLSADLGAYLLTTTPIPPRTAAMLLTGCYDIPAAEAVVIGARTNKVPTGPYRGAGRPEAAYMLECLVDDAARQIGLDRVELRRRNLVRRFPHRTPLGYEYDSGDYDSCLDAALALASDAGGSASAHGRVAGTGVALFVERAGGAWEAASISIEKDGRVLVRSGSSPHGQGHDTTFAQIVAERLGVEPHMIELRFGDSAEVPAGVGTFGSRSVAVGGSAVASAVDELIEALRGPAARVLDATPDELVWEPGRFSFGERSVGVAELAVMSPGLSVAARFSSPPVFSSGAYVAAVEIERATGELRVLSVGAVDDAGTIINPLLSHGQVIGGVVQGLGECLTEEVVHGGGGDPLSVSLMNYGLLTAADVPSITTAVVCTPSPLNPLGAKGVGEGGAIGTLPAVANAVADALGGRRVDPPFTAEKLWRALR
jgi:carbon-monoxide dehydrogenase large subunit